MLSLGTKYALLVCLPLLGIFAFFILLFFYKLIAKCCNYILGPDIDNVRLKHMQKY